MKQRRVIWLNFCFLLLSSIAYAQQAEAPVYKDGDWWKIKVEVRYGAGISKSGFCDEAYPEYMVKVDQTKKKVYGIKDDKQEELDCPDVLSQLLGIETGGSDSQKYLAYPLAIGKSWTARVAEELAPGKRKKGSNIKWVDLEYKVLGWETVKTTKGQLGAFKIEVSGWPWGEAPTYYYSPDAKAIVRFRGRKERVTRIVTLLDYSVSK